RCPVIELAGKVADVALDHLARLAVASCGAARSPVQHSTDRFDPVRYGLSGLPLSDLWFCLLWRCHSKLRNSCLLYSCFLCGGVFPPSPWGSFSAYPLV